MFFLRGVAMFSGLLIGTSCSSTTWLRRCHVYYMVQFEGLFMLCKGLSFASFRFLHESFFEKAKKSKREPKRAKRDKQNQQRQI